MDSKSAGIFSEVVLVWFWFLNHVGWYSYYSQLAQLGDYETPEINLFFCLSFAPWQNSVCFCA